jgi:hypothetical protein
MVLTYGDVSKFGDLKWYYLELRSERTIEPTLGRLGRNLRSIFQEGAVEIFIPIAKRDLNVCDLNTVNCVYVRSPSFAKLLRLKTVTGVVGLLTKGDSLRPADALSLENSFVQTEIAKAEAEFQERPRLIREGSFVRILDGEYRDWCGLVTAIQNGWAAVVIEIKTKIITVETPVHNLINKDHVPTTLRVFYYWEQVEGLAALNLEHMISEDLEYRPELPEQDDHLEVPQPTKHGRQQTVTSLVKRLILQGTTNPRKIAKEVILSLKANKLRKPKNLAIVHGIIKTKLVTEHYGRLDPKLKTYREVVNAHPEAKLTSQDLKDIEAQVG